ncbi:MAG: hypothetical protein J6U58_07465 [Bacteroidaceae bacterium]|nr:hypothetical protein [Bacteroidaceae bacterium]
MTLINIIVNYEKILERIYTESGYTAMARSNIGISSELSDSMAATEEDKRVLENNIISGAKEAAVIITRYMTPCSIDISRTSQNNAIEKIELGFTLPGNYPTEIITTLEQCIEDFITTHALQQWMMIMKPDETSLVAMRMQSEAVRMREILTARKRPTT